MSLGRVYTPPYSGAKLPLFGIVSKKNRTIGGNYMGTHTKI